MEVDGVLFKDFEKLLKGQILNSDLRYLFFDLELQFKWCPDNVILQVVGLTHHTIRFFAQLS